MNDNNVVTVTGKFSKYFEYAYRDKNKVKHYISQIEIPRFSGTTDKIKVITNKMIDIELDRQYRVIGEFRSKDVKNHLVLFIYTDEIEETDAEAGNSVVLNAFVCKKPTLRETPLGRTISDVFVAIDRNGKNDYIPCVAWGKCARDMQNYEVGDSISIRGRIQSREYTKNDKTMTAYEVSVMEVLEDDVSENESLLL